MGTSTFLMTRITILFFACLLLFNSCKTSVQSNPVVIDPQDKNTTINTVEKPKEKLEPSRRVSLDEKIGQMVMIGLNDRKIILPTDCLISEVKKKKIGGIIIFEKNITKKNSADSLKKLIADIQAVGDNKLFVSIDEEGGKVHRLKEKYGFVAMPAAAVLGKLNNTDSTYFYNKRLADELKELGINLNYAPAVDLALNPNNPIIAKVLRSYSPDPALVTKHALVAIKAHHDAGVKTIIKHFPGHGSSAQDTHLGIANVSNYWQEIELNPYKDIIKSGQVDAIMTAHIVNCKLDSTCLPATLSNIIVTGLLREKMNYKGVIFSDDMQMHAISKQYGMEDAIRRSILAGVDVLVFGNNVPNTEFTTATRVHAIIKYLVTSGQISEERIDESYKRIVEFKKK